MFSTTDLTDLRKEAENAMPDSATPHTLSTVSDTMGGDVNTFTPGTAVSCRVQPLGGARELAIADRLGSDVAWEIVLPQGTSVAAKDRLVGGSRSFEIAGILAERSYEVHRRVLCREVL